MTMLTDLEADPETLNTRLGIAGRVRFEASALGGTVVVLEHPRGRATVALFGGQVIDWQPAGQASVLWLSPVARLDEGKAVRGGVPVCWPWFGPPGRSRGERQAGTGPQHGFARTATWQAVETGDSTSGPWVTLALTAPSKAGKGWPGKVEVRLTVVVGETLELRLVTRNLGAAPLVLTQALHAYFQVGDIEEIQVEGLDGHVFHNAVALGPAMAISTSLNSQIGAVTFAGEVDRIYLEQRGPVSIVDRRLGRRITMTKRGSKSTVVWNPWRDKAGNLGDLGEEGYRQMVCVEAANTVYDAVKVPPGETRELAAVYECGPA